MDSIKIRRDMNSAHVSACLIKLTYHCFMFQEMSIALKLILTLKVTFNLKPTLEGLVKREPRSGRTPYDRPVNPTDQPAFVNGQLSIDGHIKFKPSLVHQKPLPGNSTSRLRGFKDGFLWSFEYELIYLWYIECEPTASASYWGVVFCFPNSCYCIEW